MSKRWYEHWLQEASFCERHGSIAAAIKALNKAEKHTLDEEELRYLNIWRNRLKKETPHENNS